MLHLSLPFLLSVSSMLTPWKQDPDFGYFGNWLIGGPMTNPHGMQWFARGRSCGPQHLGELPANRRPDIYKVLQGAVCLFPQIVYALSGTLRFVATDHVPELSCK